jgi:hypothetical protein
MTDRDEKIRGKEPEITHDRAKSRNRTNEKEKKHKEDTAGNSPVY